MSRHSRTDEASAAVLAMGCVVVCGAATVAFARRRAESPASNRW